MLSILAAFIKLLVAGVFLLGLPVAFTYLFVKLVQLLAWLVRGIGRTGGVVLGRAGGFLRREVRDVVATIGAALTAGVVVPLALLNLLTGRWQSARHYGNALEDELLSGALSFYRVVIGNPVRFIGLGGLTDGIERRLPDLVAQAPSGRRKRGKPGHFEGYEVTGDLPAGGSGAQLFLARPLPAKTAELRTAGRSVPDEVVIKSFALANGSTLPQIVRESRALEAAKRLGLVLEHELSDERFHYVMPYVAGPGLDAVIRRMHAKASPDGLKDKDFQLVFAYMGDLLETLERFHRGGLWHKDIKPSNLIVADRLHLVDLGLVTPLQSAMTLTTHGTEFYRDPQMVRLAMQGVKVHEVDGVKFDIYSAGAVLFNMIENSFPAHGNLSPLTKRCPESLQWIVRRAMADMSQRYGSANEMLADLRALSAARDPFEVKPADLPSLGGSHAPRRVAGAPELSSSEVRSPAPSLPPVELRPHAAKEAKEGRRKVRRALAASVMALAGVVAFRANQATERSRARTAEIIAHNQAMLLASAHSYAESVRDESGQEKDWPASRWMAGLRSHLGKRSTASSAPRTCLVINDAAAESNSALQGLVEALDRMGFSAVGLSEEPGSEEIDLIAAARKVLALGDVYDVESALRLEHFLDTTDGLDAVIWLAPERGGPGLVYRVIASRTSLAEPSVFEL
jgi:serine/threonine protein kinase